MREYPCDGCTKRWVKVIDGKLTRCHSACKEYIDARAENTAEKDRERAIKDAELDAAIYQRDGYEKRKKKARLSV